MDRYEEAIERAKKGLPIDEVFPELKKIDNDKTRQMIVNTLRDAYLSERISKTSYREMLTYLEKQKEKWWNKGYFEGRKNAHIYSPFTILFG